MEPELEQALRAILQAVEAGRKESADRLNHLRDCLYGSEGHEGDIVTMKAVLAKLPCVAHGRQLARHQTTLTWQTWLWRGLVASAITGGGIALGAGKAAAAAVLHIASRL